MPIPDKPSASEAPARLLLLTGAPASGKSWLAAALVQRYRARLCAKDEIKELLFDAVGTGDAEHSRRLSDASFAVLFAFLPRLLRPGGLLLLDGNFRRGTHEQALDRVLSGEAALLAQVCCHASLATRAARLAARATDGTRHPGHRDGRSPAATVSGEDFLDLPGPRWAFDSDQPWEQALDALASGLDSWGMPPRAADT